MSQPVKASIVAMLAVITLSAGSVVQAQSPAPGKAWIVGDAAGYGFIGATVGFIGGIAVSDDSWDAIPAVLGGAALGGVLGALGGAKIAVTARETVLRGGEISRGQRTAMTMGMVLGGAAAGAVASIALIQPSGSGTPFGNDELTFLGLTFLGGATGGVIAARHSSELGTHKLSVSPIIAPKGYGMRAGLTF